MTIPAGSNVAGPFFYQDTQAGSPVLTAAAAGVTSGTQTETVLPGPITGVSVKPSSSTVAAAGSLTFAAFGVDSFGNVVPAAAGWSLDPGGLGKIVSQGATAIFTAGARGGAGRVTATITGPSGPLSATASVTVRPGRIAVSSIRYGIGRNAILVSATVVNGAKRPVSSAVVRLIVRRNGYRVFPGAETDGGQREGDLPPAIEEGLLPHRRSSVPPRPATSGAPRRRRTGSVSKERLCDYNGPSRGCSRAAKGDGL